MANNNHRATQGESGLSSLQTGDTASRDGAEVISAETLAPIVDTSWDPYQVWLTRVEQPREQSARLRRQARTVAAQPSSPDLTDTARLRTLTLAR